MARAVGSKLSLPLPRDLHFPATVCSYGYYLLAPNLWQPQSQTLLTSVRGPEGRLVHTEVGTNRAGDKLIIRCHRRASPSETQAIKAALTRMLRLDEDQTGWWKLNPGAKRRHFGRLFRTASFFEDAVKTITGCNVTWPNTVRMNALLCEHVGSGGFPTPEQVVDFGADRLKLKCKVGYRAERIWRLARDLVSGALDPQWFESPDRQSEALYKSLLKLHGVGPYAASNLCMLLGHYDRVAIDTETYRHYSVTYRVPRPKTAPGLKAYEAKITKHYAQTHPYQFKQYWFELWKAYENKRGRSWTWEPKTTGVSFTANQLRD